jgi:hypothetical protein
VIDFLDDRCSWYVNILHVDPIYTAVTMMNSNCMDKGSLTRSLHVSV